MHACAASKASPAYPPASALSLRSRACALLRYITTRTAATNRAVTATRLRQSLHGRCCMGRAAGVAVLPSPPACGCCCCSTRTAPAACNSSSSLHRYSAAHAITCCSNAHASCCHAPHAARCAPHAPVRGCVLQLLLAVQQHLLPRRQHGADRLAAGRLLTHLAAASAHQASAIAPALRMLLQQRKQALLDGARDVWVVEHVYASTATLQQLLQLLPLHLLLLLADDDGGLRAQALRQCSGGDACACNACRRLLQSRDVCVPLYLWCPAGLAAG